MVILINGRARASTRRPVRSPTPLFPPLQPRCPYLAGPAKQRQESASPPVPSNRARAVAFLRTSADRQSVRANTRKEKKIGNRPSPLPLSNHQFSNSARSRAVSSDPRRRNPRGRSRRMRSTGDVWCQNGRGPPVRWPRGGPAGTPPVGIPLSTDQRRPPPPVAHELRPPPKAATQPACYCSLDALKARPAFASSLIGKHRLGRTGNRSPFPQIWGSAMQARRTRHENIPHPQAPWTCVTGVLFFLLRGRGTQSTPIGGGGPCDPSEFNDVRRPSPLPGR